jgi:CDP-glucose 4,6-dehydratase
MNPAFWSGKRVFLTGHTGFKGSWLSLWLQSMGAEVTGYALEAHTKPSLFEDGNVGVAMSSIIADVRDMPTLQNAILQAKPDIVIHMAAQALVRYSYQNPVDTYSTNIMGTVHLLEAVRNSQSVKAVVVVTTDKCYENKEWLWGYREDDPMGGFDPYSNSKGCAELVTSAYRRSFFKSKGIALATARAGNVIGGGDWAQDRLIPDILSAFEQGKLAHIRNPQAVRPWQHVLEPLRGYLTLAEYLFEQGPSFAEAWNFGPNDEDARPVSWIAKQMAQMWGESAQWELDKSDHPHEANYLKLDISKAGSRLGWRPALRLNEALKLIIDWSKQRQLGADVHNITMDQIQNYQTLIQS